MAAKLFVASLGVMGMVAIFSLIFIDTLSWYTEFYNLLILPIDTYPDQYSCPWLYSGSPCKLYTWLPGSVITFFGVAIFGILVALIWPVE